MSIASWLKTKIDEGEVAVKAASKELKAAVDVTKETLAPEFAKLKEASQGAAVAIKEQADKAATAVHQKIKDARDKDIKKD